MIPVPKPNLAPWFSVTSEQGPAQLKFGPNFNPNLKLPICAVPLNANSITRLIINDILFIIIKFRPTKVIYFADIPQNSENDSYFCNKFQTIKTQLQ